MNGAEAFFTNWHSAARTTVGLFWMAFWAFGLGYFISSLIQVFVTRARMRRSLGSTTPRTVAVASFFGFLSSSCSFSALATTRALFAKGAGFVPSLAFMLASTNLVVELGIVIAIFLGWQFVVGEYVGGVLLIVLMWAVVIVTCPQGLVKKARARAREGVDEAEEPPEDWRRLAKSPEGWRRVASQYVMEWHMVWKDVTIGFTIAGVIAAFVPRRFFQALFVGAGESDPAFWQLLLQVLVGPIAAFLTFIGSMGNIPLAAVLFGNGVSFAGVMAFIFSDLVVLPVLRIQSRYYGWAMALYLLAVMLLVLSATALLLHFGFAAFGLLPDPAAAEAVTERNFFAVDYTLWLNLLFILLSAGFLVWRWAAEGLPAAVDSTTERVLLVLSILALTWLAVGLLLPWLPVPQPAPPLP